MPGPTFLRGDRIDLCPVEEADLAFVQRAINDPRVRATLRSSTPKNREQEREWLESLDDRDGETLLLVARGGAASGASDASSKPRSDGEPVGTAGLGALDVTWGTAEVGYSVAREHWGNGYATEAVALLTRYAFEERRLAKLYATVYAHNPASMRVLEKAGWHEEAVLEREAFRDGERVDCHRYAAFADEWEPTDERARAALDAGTDEAGD
jgi:RimJ/RimL family protein N-acetyltransferase